MASSPLQGVVDAGKKSFLAGAERKVPREYASMDLMRFAYLKGYDELALRQQH